MLDKGNSVWYNYFTFYVGNGVADRGIIFLRSANKPALLTCGVRNMVKLLRLFAYAK